MSAFTVELQVPESMSELGFTPDEIRREVPFLLILKRFRQGAISSGKAAAILGISRRDFLDLLAREGVPFFDPNDEELAEEFKRVQRLASAS